ncbi:MAG: tetraether lipid synthase Tes, partial [Syntrophobacter sp.]
WSFEEGAGLRNPKVTDATHCPSQCGMCNLHQSHTLLGQIDLTNRCNLACPICFANADIKKYVYEPTYEEIVGLMRNLRDYRPCPATAVQFSGGEPTLHPDFLRIVKTANEIGFSHVQIASNGIRLADPDFAMQCARAGLHTIYLQFDGVEDRIYELTRGRKLFDLKKRAIESIHEAGMKTCLVPTIVKGVNDDQVSKILRFAIDNIHAISAIAYQPVAFTGRISTSERESQRYTLGDLAADIASSGFAEVDRDFYPLSIIAPISRLLSSIQGAPKITPTSHPSCSGGTFFVVDENKKATPIPVFFDVEGLFSDIDDLAYAMKNSKFKFLYKVYVYFLFRKHFRKDKAPRGLTVSRFIHALRGMTDKRVGRGKAGEKTYRTLMAAAMHFQDRYNFDVERVKRCVIHYSTPEGMFPFCTYNSGPVHRNWIEQKHSIPLDEWRKKNTPA